MAHSERLSRREFLILAAGAALAACNLEGEELDEITNYDAVFLGNFEFKITDKETYIYNQLENKILSQRKRVPTNLLQELEGQRVHLGDTILVQNPKIVLNDYLVDPDLPGELSMAWLPMRGYANEERFPLFVKVTPEFEISPLDQSLLIPREDVKAEGDMYNIAWNGSVYPLHKSELGILEVNPEESEEG